MRRRGEKRGRTGERVSAANLAKAQQKLERGQRAKGQAGHGERSEVCNGGSKEKERGRRGREERREKEEDRGEGLHAAGAPLT